MSGDREVLRDHIRAEIDGMEVGFVESYGHTYYLADHCAATRSPTR